MVSHNGDDSMLAANHKRAAERGVNERRWLTVNHDGLICAMLRSGEAEQFYAK